MRKLTTILTLALSLVALAAAAQVRGKGRLQGSVTDKATGKPVQGAVVTVAPADGSTTPIVAKTDAKGRWSALGLTGGAWNVDIEAAGYVTSRGAANVSEVSMLPPIRTELAPEVKEEAPAQVESSVPQEAREAVDAGQAFIAQEKYKEAAEQFERAAALLPDNMSLRKALSHAYYKAGEIAKSIATLEAVAAADAADTSVAPLLMNMYVEMGGRLYNDKKAAEAVAYFAKAIDLDGKRADAFYYRGLANLQLSKTAEAKADFQKVIELAPESPEAGEAKQLLAGLK